MTATPAPLKSRIKKSIPQRILALGSWLINLFDPPPLKSMTFVQKVGRVAMLTSTLVIGSVLVAMIGAMGLFLVERGRLMGDVPEFYNGVIIILIGIDVNLACVFMLIQIKRADTKLVPPKK